MKYINDWDEVNKLAIELKELKNNNPNIRINKFPFMGTLHKGHIQLIEEIKKESDILIVHYNEVMTYLNLALWNESYFDKYREMGELAYYGLFIQVDACVGNVADYFVITKVPEDGEVLLKIYRRIYKDFLIVKEEALRLNLPYNIAVEVMYIHVKDPFHGIINADKSGAKQALQFLIHSKLFNKQFFYDTDVNKYILWKIYTDENGEAFSRTKKHLAFVRPKVVGLFNSGCRDYEKYRQLIVGQLIGNKTFSVIDINTIERIYEITDNCFIVYGCVLSYEIIIIKDGVLI